MVGQDREMPYNENRLRNAEKRGFMNDIPDPSSSAGKKNGLILISFITSCALAVAVLFFNFFILSGFDTAEPPEGKIRNQNDLRNFYSRNLDRILDNTAGSVPILEYHIIETPTVESNLFLTGKIKKDRTTERFIVTSGELRSQLETLYANGFRNISLSEYLSLMKGKRKGLERLKPGSKLYCITFDDATYGQFDFLEIGKNGETAIDPDSAVGIMIALAEKYPDFKLNAAFCVDFENAPFVQGKYVSKKLNMLVDLGFELVNHTRNHNKLSHYFPKRMAAAAYEIGKPMELFRYYIGSKADSIDKVCYPDGRSNPMVWAMISNFTYNGKTYRFVCGLDAKGYQAKNPNHREFNPFNISRIETSKFSFKTYVLDARNVFTLPDMADVASNRSGLFTSDVKTELIRLN